MTSGEMASDDVKKQREVFIKEGINDSALAIAEGTKSELIKCGGCGKSNTTYHQAQTRWSLLLISHENIVLPTSCYFHFLQHHLTIVIQLWEQILHLYSKCVLYQIQCIQLSIRSFYSLLPPLQVCWWADDYVCAVQRMRQTMEILLKNKNNSQRFVWLISYQTNCFSKHDVQL